MAGLNGSSEYKHIFLLPGIDGTGRLFRPLAAALGYRCRTTALSYRDESTMDDYIESISCWLPKRRALILAESFSGPIALALLARFPGRFEAAILSTTFAQSPFGAFFGLSKLVTDTLFGNPTLESVLLDKFCQGNSIPDSIKKDVLALSPMIPSSVLKKRIQFMEQVDVRELLPNISTPILYLNGSQDNLVTSRLREELYISLPQICFKGIEGPHLLLQTQPQVCADTIMNFLEMSEH